jgi:hypothetical protein
VCEHYIAHGLCTDFPDWSIAAAGSEDSVKIGYDYGRFVTGKEQHIDLNLTEEAVSADNNQIVPTLWRRQWWRHQLRYFFVSDCSTVIVEFFFVLLFTILHSVLLQALEELGIDAVDLADEAPSIFESLSDASTASNTPEDVKSPGTSTATNGDGETPIDREDSKTADAESPSGWKSIPLPDATPGRRRNVAHKRAMGGDPTCVSPDFNSSMLTIWEELWHSMPRSGKVSVTVNSLLQNYKERCRTEKKRPRDSTKSPAALLPVSFVQAKDWLLKLQKTLSEPLQTGAVNEEAREVVVDLNHSLAQQPASTAALLEKPARPASPMVPPAVISLGPEQVTDSVRAEERAEERARQKAEKPRAAPTCSPKTPPPKKRKTILPEMEER